MRRHLSNTKNDAKTDAKQRNKDIVFFAGIAILYSGSESIAYNTLQQLKLIGGGMLWQMEK
jgi:hypothetical protein